MDVNIIIESLAWDYEHHAETMENKLPDTSTDKKVSADTEGKIGLVMSELMWRRFRRFHDSLMVFGGEKWELMDPEKVAMLVAGFMRKMGIAPCYQARSVSNVYKMIIRNPFLQNFEAKRNVIFMKNCALILGKGDDIVVREKSPELMTNIYLDFPYVDFAACDNWERFLATVLDDVDARKVLQEFLGCMFIDKDELSIEKALFCYGTGSNGKSVIFETLQVMLGDNLTNVGLDSVNGKSGEYYTAAMIGKLLAYNSDAEAKDIGSGKYKQLISKEKIAVRPIRQAPFESDDWPMFMANINRGLITTDSSDGFWRRNIVIWFDKVFSDNPDLAMGQLKADRSFKTSLRDEIPGIFNWILKGRQRILKQRGVFTKSKSIDEITNDMRNSSTGVYGFLAEKGYSPNKVEGVECKVIKIAAKDIYKEYLEWCNENGYRDPKHMGGFRNDMVNSKFKWERCMRLYDKVTSGYTLYKLPEGYVGMELDAAEEDAELWDDLPLS